MTTACLKPIHFVVMTTTGKAWKRMITKVTFVGEGFTRKPPKYERFIRPMVIYHGLLMSALFPQLTLLISCLVPSMYSCVITGVFVGRS